MNTSLVIDRVFDAPVDHLWQALTKRESIKEWYFAQVQQFEPIVGFVFGLSDDGSGYQKEWTVTQVVEGQKLAHTWAYKGYRVCSEVAFDLFGEGAKTRLRITHTGLETFPLNAHFARQRFAWGWDLIGDKLSDFLAK